MFSYRNSFQGAALSSTKFINDLSNCTFSNCRNEPQFCIVYDYDLFRKNANYLPKLCEHKIQEEPNYVIDDPSSIFFDPDEKSGFVYGFSEISDYDLQTSQEIKTDAKKPKARNASLDSSLDLDDSLDLISNIPPTPTVGEASFDREYGRGSSEPEMVDSCDEANYHTYQINMNSTPVNLMLSSDEKMTASQLTNLRIYEDSGYGSGGQRQKKDYNSDAESTNKYQDSGIYEDDVFPDSPKHLSKLENGSFIHDVEFEMDDFLPEHSERNTAFKTPSSSPLKLVPNLPLTKVNGAKEKQKGKSFIEINLYLMLSH